MKKLSCLIVVSMSIHLFTGIFISSCLAAGISPIEKAFSQTSIEDVHVSLNVQQVTIEAAFQSIADQTEFKFVYGGKAQPFVSTQEISLNVENKSVADVLRIIARETGANFMQSDLNIIVQAPPPGLIKGKIPEREEKEFLDRTIKGKITDENGEPLSGATILVKGTTIGAIADLEGSYTISVPDDATTLVFTFIGFVPQEISIGGRNVIDVVMVADLTTLDELVVVGYGEQSKQKLTSAVSKVTAKDIENLPVTSFEQALQGITPGVHVTSASGVPGGAVLVRIRGQSSINAGSDPLYVIDGVPLLAGGLVPASNQSLTGQLNVLSGINPEDIASIEVLKDAAATAIYGSRGANGVVLISTKTGQGGRTNVRFDVMGGLSQATELLDVLNSREYLEIKREAYENDGLPIPDDLSAENPEFDTDWQDEIYRTARLNQYQLSIDGGNESSTFYLGAGYRDEQAILENSGLKRANFRFNFDHQASDKIDLGVRLAFSREENTIFSRGGNIASPINSAIAARPDFPVRDSLGEYTIPTIVSGSRGSNPVEEILETKMDNQTSKLVGNIYLNYSILPWLNFRTDAGYEYNVFQQDIFFPSSTLFGSLTGGRGIFGVNQTNTYNIEPTLRLERTIDQEHTVNAVIGTTIMNRLSTDSRIFGQDFISDKLPFLISAGQIANAPSTGNTQRDYSFNSVFGRLNYDYQGKYLFSATIRRDGSSRFGPENRFGTFWALSGGWVFSDESFMDNLGWISFGKIRASYGVTGNDQIGNFANLTQWTAAQGYGGNPGRQPSQLGNPGLRWEETSQLDIGLDLSFFGERLALQADYFVSRTKDLLLNQPLPGTAGFQNVFNNIGEIENRGFEVGLSTINIQTNRFTWTSRLNLTQVDNKIISLANDEPILTAFGGYFIGEPINIIRGLDFLGVDPETGDAMYRDVNDDGEITFAEDRVVLGNTLPDFYGGLTNSFSWNGISLDIFLQFVNNVDRLDNSALSSYLTAGTDRDNQARMILDRWQSPGDITDVPRVTTAAGVGLNNTLSNRFIWDASYLRIKNITLSYTLSPSLTQNWGVQHARIYITGTNLYTFTDYPGQDPEANSISGSADGVLQGNLPQVRSFLAGINLTF